MRKLWILPLAFVLSISTLQAAEGGGDEAQIRKVHEEFAAAWNRHDTKAMAGVWAPDGDLINPEGRVGKGRAEIEKLFSEEQAGIFKGTTFTHSINRVNLLTPTVAIVDASFEVTNMTTPTGQGGEPLGGLYTSVMIKKGGKWWTASARAMVPAKMAGGTIQ